MYSPGWTCPGEGRVTLESSRGPAPGPALGPAGAYSPLRGFCPRGPGISGGSWAEVVDLCIPSTQHIPEAPGAGGGQANTQRLAGVTSTGPRFQSFFHSY